MTERSHFYRSPDGLTLFARDFGPLGAPRTTVLCLAGLTRNSRDFGPLAARLATERRVLCPDYRGRGRSQYAGDPATYNPLHELADSLALLDHLAVPQTAVIGTSRGGIIAMLMAQRAPRRVKGVVLNDIGPHIDQGGLLRIARYLGVGPALASWEDAVDVLKQTHPGFDTLAPAEWLAFAQRVFRDDEGRPKVDYDLKLAEAFPSAADIAEKGLPDLWEPFAALRGMPAAVLRAEHSDLLSAETVAAMQKLIPALITATIADRGHVPFLDEPESLAAIGRVLSDCDTTAQA